MRDDALETLQFHWGDAYDITRNAAGRCLAVRRDGIGAELVAPDPEKLNELIAVDYRANPVRRDIA